MRFRTPLLILAILAACNRPLIYHAPAPVPAPEPAREAAPAAPPPTTDLSYAESRELVIPVAGIKASRLHDSYDEGRDDGARVHRAIDILAPRGTPVIAADDGEVVRLTTSQLGGISIYAVDPAQRLVYYYAHLDHYTDSLHVGQVLLRGDTIGFVGTTGNAPKDAPHLHFQVMRMPENHKGWNGAPINPFPLLRPNARAAATTAGHTP